jgi:hypothetical protein
MNNMQYTIALILIVAASGKSSLPEDHGSWALLLYPLLSYIIIGKKCAQNEKEINVVRLFQFSVLHAEKSVILIAGDKAVI